MHRSVNGVLILSAPTRLTGDAETDQLTATLGRLSESGTNRLIVDLRPVETFNSTGTGELVQSHVRLQRSGGHLVLLCARSSRIDHYFCITRLNLAMTVCYDEQAALEAVKKPPSEIWVVRYKA